MVGVFPEGPECGGSMLEREQWDFCSILDRISAFISWEAVLVRVQYVLAGAMIEIQ